ncbi:adenylosuccinate synthetase [Pedobacter caeni]|uniref:Adenylosuccinate synthetase n=1 Tax=Pedobacter caeni TaxID=288992 RepID=A0A1M5JLK4_9SPHI|nr:adenylosuccinate synthetase [Pedobacter caeni]SHG41454.1 adenylosuccinate synthase [Pedobacter caeni]
MKRPANIVIGLGYGDEGKGLSTDYLCAQSENPLVIRFNGGQQAGHTVCTADGKRHVFSSFGAGTLRGAGTYWSAYCTLSVPALLNEYQALLKINIKPQLYIDPTCALTTHYDVLYNRLQEQYRGNARHGSCGAGFGTTLQRQEEGPRLSAAHMLAPHKVLAKLESIREYYRLRAEAELGMDFSAFEHDKEDERFTGFLEEFRDLSDQAFYLRTAAEIFADPQWDQYVFEGAQGVLLDMDFGSFPHVTRSNTTSKNALELINSHPDAISSTSIYYVSRVYHTRHGEGPFVKHGEALILKNNEQETNVFNDHQGDFRTGPLDLDLVNYALVSDGSISKGIEKNLVLTCADQVEESNLPLIVNGVLRKGTVNQIPGLLGEEFNGVRISRSHF